MLRSRSKKNILILGSNSDIAINLAMNLSANNYNIIFHFNKKKNLIDKKINNFKNLKIKADLSNKN